MTYYLSEGTDSFLRKQSRARTFLNIFFFAKRLFLIQDVKNAIKSLEHIIWPGFYLQKRRRHPFKASYKIYLFFLSSSKQNNVFHAINSHSLIFPFLTPD